MACGETIRKLSVWRKKGFSCCTFLLGTGDMEKVHSVWRFGLRLGGMISAREKSKKRKVTQKTEELTYPLQPTTFTLHCHERLLWFEGLSSLRVHKSIS